MLKDAPKQIVYGAAIESAIDSIQKLLAGNYAVSKKAIAILLLQGDTEIADKVKAREGDHFERITEIISQAQSGYGQELSYVMAMSRQQHARDILAKTVVSQPKIGKGFAERLSRITMHPVTGIPILIAVLYVGLYWFVGVFGAGTLVGLLEENLFQDWLNPLLLDAFEWLIPVDWLRNLFVGEFGIFTMGLTYAFAIILPIVGTFFIVFSIIEDSGYLPRLAMLLDRIFKKIGLSGRAVIPMVLGLGCDTMATIVTRTQETKRERIITTLLLALAIPCSAQLGVILGILSTNGMALLIWIITMLFVLLLIGYLASKVIPGKKTNFYMEIPPLRLPRLSNVLAKTYARLQWYLKEVVPFFVLASFVLWLGDLTGVFDYVIKGLEPIVRGIGLPNETSEVFLIGFFRRDFGAAGLYTMVEDGLIAGVPLVVAAVTLTLFVPCIAQFLVMIKERGKKVALAITAFVFPFAFFVGFLLNTILNALGIKL
ncbi:MAG: ferrous iron transporter B [Chloroflexi bacterium]|jgi:ferrous iron transport protein B|nr:ferrous iron transporter B [Chloroflexota bacterium]MBT7079918.1 ferrous iron transporter B [Chloroflexota bacterium]MBT7290108.1 ferrous iron transporter B [Chloroflexota bacterium]